MFLFYLPQFLLEDLIIKSGDCKIKITSFTKSFIIHTCKENLEMWSEWNLKKTSKKQTAKVLLMGKNPHRFKQSHDFLRLTHDFVMFKVGNTDTLWFRWLIAHWKANNQSKQFVKYPQTRKYVSQLLSKGLCINWQQIESVYITASQREKRANQLISCFICIT